MIPPQDKVNLINKQNWDESIECIEIGPNNLGVGKHPEYFGQVSARFDKRLFLSASEMAEIT